MGKSHVGWAVTVLVGMVAILGLAVVATKLVGDGTARQFSIEPSSEDYQAAAAGQNMMGEGCLLFAGLAVLAFACYVSGGWQPVSWHPSPSRSWAA